MTQTNKVHQVVGAVEIREIPYEVMVPVFVKKDMPEYVLVKEEVVYKVPKIEYENKTYEKPILKEKEYIVPKYVEKVYEVPKIVYKEVVYEKPIYKEKIINVPKIVEQHEIKVIEEPYVIKVPNLVKEDVKVTNAVIEDKHVINAKIEHVTVEALHPKYLCSKCRKNEVDV